MASAAVVWLVLWVIGTRRIPGPVRLGFAIAVAAGPGLAAFVTLQLVKQLVGTLHGPNAWLRIAALGRLTVPERLMVALWLPVALIRSVPLSARHLQAMPDISPQARLLRFTLVEFLAKALNRDVRELGLIGITTLRGRITVLSEDVVDLTGVGSLRLSWWQDRLTADGINPDLSTRARDKLRRAQNEDIASPGQRLAELHQALAGTARARIDAARLRAKLHARSDEARYAVLAEWLAELVALAERDRARLVPANLQGVINAQQTEISHWFEILPHTDVTELVNAAEALLVDARGSAELVAELRRVILRAPDARHPGPTGVPDHRLGRAGKAG